VDNLGTIGMTRPLRNQRDIPASDRFDWNTTALKVDAARAAQARSRDRARSLNAPWYPTKVFPELFERHLGEARRQAQRQRGLQQLDVARAGGVHGALDPFPRGADPVFVTAAPAPQPRFDRLARVIDTRRLPAASMRSRGDALQVVGVQRELIAEVHPVGIQDLRCLVNGAAVVWQLHTTAPEA
jgi:hypothetical protein